MIREVEHRINNLKQAQVFADDIEREKRQVPKDIQEEVEKAKPQIEALERVRELLHKPVTEEDIVKELQAMKERVQPGKTKTLIEKILGQLQDLIQTKEF